MNKTFADWKKYIQDIDSIVKSTHKVNGEHRLIGNKFVMAYQENSLFSLGMCVQNDQKEVRILIASEGEEALFRNCFEPNKVEGLMHIHGNIEIGYVVEGSAYQNILAKSIILNREISGLLTVIVIIATFIRQTTCSVYSSAFRPELLIRY